MLLRRLKLPLSIAAITLTLFITYCAWIAQGPDRELQWTRDVPLRASADHTAKAIRVLSNWKNWIYSGAEVQRLDVAGRVMPMQDQIVEKGALLQLKIDPKKGAHRKFDLLVLVTNFEPGVAPEFRTKVDLQVLKDSSGRLTKLFSELTWTVETLPSDTNTPLVRGTEHAKTQHWRSRVFATLSERIMMHQAFFPDLHRLSAITQPTDPNPRPAHEQ